MQAGAGVTTLNRLIKTEAYRLVFWQLIVVMGLALILLLLQGIYSGLSALLGGLAYCVPNMLFVWRVFHYAGASLAHARRFLTAFIVGEVFKIILSGILFLLILTYLPVLPFSVLIGFVGAIISFWFVSLFYLLQPQRGVK